MLVLEYKMPVIQIVWSYFTFFLEIKMPSKFIKQECE